MDAKTKKKCKICLEHKMSCRSLFETIMEKYLPSVIEYVCGVQISVLDEPDYLVCIDCVLAMIQAECIIKKFRTSQEFLHKEQLIKKKEPLQINAEDDSVMLEMNSTCSDEVEMELVDVNALKKCSVIKEQGSSDKHSFQCELCVFKPNSAKVFREHMIRQHNIEKPRIFKCKDCTTSYVEYRSLQHHIHRTHERLPRLTEYLCSECGKAFRKNSHLMRHSFVHRPEDRPFKCEYCPMQFVNGSCVKRHMEAKHSTVRPFACDLCDKSFGLIYGLKAHMRRVHNQQCFECPVCGKKFHLDKLLESHLRNGCLGK